MIMIFKMKTFRLVMVMLILYIITTYMEVCSSIKTECILENDSAEHCLSDDDSDMKCHSLNELPDILNDTDSEIIRVLFCSTVFNVHVNIMLQGIRNIRFIGFPSIFNCSDGAGLTFIDSENIVVSNITLNHCGVLHNSTTVNVTSNNSTITFRSGMYILNVTNITIEAVTISYSDGVGLTLFDAEGIVEIRNCTFENNSINENDAHLIPGGGGVYIEFTYCLPGQYDDNCDRHSNITDGSYHFDQCKFIHNSATSVDQHKTDFAINEGHNFQGLGRGGGLNVMFRGAALRNKVTLSRCHFIGNSAIWGGGLKVTFLDQVSMNSFVANETVFETNRCISHAGGGADVGYSYFSSPFPRGNEIKFSNCNFTSNEAKFGGGLAFYSSRGTHENLDNRIEFAGCRWSHNKARFGSAIDTSTHAWTTFVSGYLPSPKFTDTTFLENSVIYKIHDQTTFSFHKKGNGAFLSTEFTIHFFGAVNFTNNNGSALYLVSSTTVFELNASVTFHNNTGFNGGAIALIGFSFLILNDSVSIVFSGNTAVRCGGAIYSFSIDKHNYVSSRNCFIQNVIMMYRNKDRTDTSVIFINNSAGMIGSNQFMHCGHSIYATTLLPCYHACKKNIADDNVSIQETFKCFGNFTFTNRNRPYELTTSGAKFTLANSYNATGPVKLIPNKQEPLPVELTDDLGQNVNAQVYLNISGDSGNKITIDRSYAFLSDNKTVLYGQPDDVAYLTLSKTAVRENAITFKFQLQQCPPGYTNINNQCVCSAGSKQFYSPVYSCDHNEFVAIVRHGYWIGYVNGETENNLLYSYCPSRRCFYHSQHDRSHRLTKTASQLELDTLVCGNETTGILCGTCRKGYSANYHSTDGSCSNKSCKYGWLLYVASELLPLTLLFIVVIVLNINFVTGELNGFVFFAQMFDSLSVTAQGFIWFPEVPFQALRAARLFFKFFNFDFFSLHELSFCLWKGATMLDMLAFKYVTVAYASLLIVIMVWLMNKCNIYQRIRCLRASTMRTSITHGLSTFLVMVYAQCATVSLKILDFTSLHSRGHIYNRSVVTYQGDMKYFYPQHLPYAIPALLCVITVVISPAIILMLYPSCFKIVLFFRLGENKCASWLLQRIPHAFLKPFVDSFQSCFKDNLRFFAGLYFVYRLVILASWLLPSLLTQRFMLLELLFVLILLVHALSQPYKKRLHNVLDALIFFNLAVINGITVYNYHYTKIDFADKLGVNFLINIQIFLTYLPIVYFVIYTLVCLVNKVRKYRKLETSALSVQLRQLMHSGSDEELPSRLENDGELAVSEDDNSIDNYQLYDEQTNVTNTY